jgi:cation transporter-like permease
VSDTTASRADAAAAGCLVIGAMAGCAAVAYGLGSLVGVAVPAGLAGLFAGLVVGLALVYARFRRI